MKCGVKAKKFQDEMNEEEVNKLRGLYSSLPQNFKYLLQFFLVFLAILLTIFAWNWCTAKGIYLYTFLNDVD